VPVIIVEEVIVGQNREIYAAEFKSKVAIEGVLEW